MNSNLAIGNWGEKLAHRFLESLGYSVVEKNWRYKRAEIDLIAQSCDRLHFFEIKTRNSSYFGPPESSISMDQEQRIFTAANVYLEQSDWEKAIQFDIISILYLSPRDYQIKLIEDAFFPGL